VTNNNHPTGERQWNCVYQYQDRSSYVTIIRFFYTGWFIFHPVYLVRKFSLIIWSRQPNRIFPSSRSVFCGGPNFRLGQSLSIIGLTNFNGHLLKLRKLSRSIIEKIVLKFSSSLCTHWRDSFNIVPDTWVLQDFFLGQKNSERVFWIALILQTSITSHAVFCRLENRSEVGLIVCRKYTWRETERIIIQNFLI
jgi:hypothetical protein